MHSAIESAATPAVINALMEASSHEHRPPELRRLGLADALNRPCPEVQHVVPGLLPGMVGAIVGPGGVGKTMLTLQMAVEYALGLAPLGGMFPAPSKPYRIALISGEETVLTCARRLHAILDSCLEGLPAADRPRVRRDYIARLDERFDLYAASGIDISFVRRGVRTPMLDTLKQIMEGRDLTFIETVSRLHSGDENAATDMAALISATEWIACSTGSAVILGHHVSKAAMFHGMGNSAAAARGSSAFADNIRWLANLFPMDIEDAEKRQIGNLIRKSYLRFEVTKANHAAPEAEKWLRRGEGGVLRLASPPPCAGSGRARVARGQTQGMVYE